MLMEGAVGLLVGFSAIMRDTVSLAALRKAVDVLWEIESWTHETMEVCRDMEVITDDKP